MNGPFRPTRHALVACICFLVFHAAGAHAAPFPTGPGSLDGVWFPEMRLNQYVEGPRQLTIKTEDGGTPPFQPWAAALLEKRLSEADAGRAFATTMSRCLTAGMPQVMYTPSSQAIKFIEKPDAITILVEELNTFRQVYMNVPHSKDPEPGFMGESVGHWEGDTLVIDTIGFNDETTLDFVGTPHSDQMHIIEHIRRIGPDEIENRITIDDPKTYTRAWNMERVVSRKDPEARLQEYACVNNRNPSVGGVSTVTTPGR